MIRALEKELFPESYDGTDGNFSSKKKEILTKDSAKDELY